MMSVEGRSRHGEWVPRRMAGRGELPKLLLEITLWIRDTRRTWFSTADVKREFTLGSKQVIRYMKVIEEVLPLEREVAERDSGGVMTYWRMR